MTFDDLRESWQESNAQAANPRTREETLVRVCRRVEGINRVILRRDLIESAAAVFVIYWFGGWFFTLSSWIAKAGAALIVAQGVFIIYKLHHTRVKDRKKDLDLNMRQYYEREAESVDRQIDMLNSIFWWYVLPCLLGANMVYFGKSGQVVESVCYFIFTIALGAGICWLNYRAVRKELTPVRDEIRELLAQLGEPNGNENHS